MTFQTDNQPSSPPNPVDAERLVSEAAHWIHPLRSEIGRYLIGQSDLVDRLLISLLVKGHILLEGVPIMGPQNRSEAARFRILIDALYENKTKLIISAAAQPEALYAQGDQAFEFERTASRLYEMRSRDYLASARGEDE